jgi:hypothetical protein
MPDTDSTFHTQLYRALEDVTRGADNAHAVSSTPEVDRHRLAVAAAQRRPLVAWLLSVSTSLVVGCREALFELGGRPHSFWLWSLRATGLLCTSAALVSRRPSPAPAPELAPAQAIHPLVSKILYTFCAKIALAKSCFLSLATNLAT